MRKLERHARILDRLTEVKDGPLMRPSELAETLGVSEVTIRRDLQELARSGAISRQHGGASLPLPQPKTSRPVGILLAGLHGKFSHPFHNAQLEGADGALAELGYHTAFLKTFAEVDGEGAILEILRQHPIVGLLVIGELDTGRQRRWSEHVPAIVSTSPVRLQNISAITCDGFAGITSVMNHLVSQGKTRISFVMSEGSSDFPDDRYVAFTRCVETLKLDKDPELIFRGVQPLTRDPTRIGREGAQKLMSLPRPPDALVCMSDLIAIGAMQWLQANNYSVPTDVSVTGFDDLEESLLTVPQLSTVHVHKELMGRLAAEQLHRHISRPDDPAVMVVTPTSLVLRASD